MSFVPNPPSPEKLRQALDICKQEGIINFREMMIFRMLLSIYFREDEVAAETAGANLAEMYADYTGEDPDAQNEVIDVEGDSTPADYPRYINPTVREPFTSCSNSGIIHAPLSLACRSDKPAC